MHRKPSDLSIMLSQPEPVSGLHTCPHIAYELLSLLVAPPDPGGVFQQGHQGHEGVIGPHHARQQAQGKHPQVV